MSRSQQEYLITIAQKEFLSSNTDMAKARRDLYYLLSAVKIRWSEVLTFSEAAVCDPGKSWMWSGLTF